MLSARARQSTALAGANLAQLWPNHFLVILQAGSDQTVVPSLSQHALLLSKSNYVNYTAKAYYYHDGGYIEEVDRTSVGVYYAEIAGPQ
ncbi:hypothetical protein VUR80DRAFT_9262 [Thermomyces stellatus]